MHSYHRLTIFWHLREITDEKASDRSCGTVLRNIRLNAAVKLDDIGYCI